MKEIPISAIARTTPVDFSKEIAPILRANCIACHSADEPEADLNLETVQSIRQGGTSGPAVVPGDSGKSRLLRLAAHRGKPAMPPRDNKVGAKPFTPDQLGLVRLWIDQGAKDSADAKPAPASWQAPAAGLHPMLALAISPDGTYAACSRADQVLIYDLPAEKFVARLTDRALSASGADRAHVDLVRSLAFSPSGDVLASGGYRTVKLWRRPKAAQDSKFPLGDEPSAVAVNAAGTLAAFGLREGRIVVRALPSGADAREIVAPKPDRPAARALAFSPDGSRLYAVSTDKIIRAWNIADGAPLADFATPSPVHSLAVLNGGRTLVSGHEDGRLRVWSVASFPNLTPGERKPVAEIAAHNRPVIALAAWPSAPGEVISASQDGWLRRWDVATAKPLREFHHGGPIAAIAARPDGSRFASVGGTVARLWNAQDGAIVAERKGDPRAQAKVRSADGQVGFASVTVDLRKQELLQAETRVADLAKALDAAKKEVEKANNTLADMREAAKAPLALKVAAEAAEKAAAETAESTRTTGRTLKSAYEIAQAADKIRREAYTYAQQAREKARAAEEAVANAETSRETAIFTVNTSRQVLERDQAIPPLAKGAVAAAETTLAQRKTAKKAAEDAALVTEQPLHAAAFSSDGAWLFMGGDAALIQTFDADKGLPSETLEGHQGPIRILSVGATGPIVAVSTTKQATVYRPAGGWTLERTIGGVDDPKTIADRVLGLDFHPDGTRLATAGGEPGRSGELKVWSVADGRLVHDFAGLHRDTIFSVRFSPDGSLLATASADRSVKISSTTAAAPPRTLAGHSNHARGVAWRADGKVLASCGGDNLVKIWSATDGSLLRTETGDVNRTRDYRREVTSISFIGDSDLILAASGDKTVRVHHAANPHFMRMCAGSYTFLYTAKATLDGKTILAGGHDGILRLWNGENGNLIREVSP